MERILVAKRLPVSLRIVVPQAEIDIEARDDVFVRGRPSVLIYPGFDGGPFRLDDLLVEIGQDILQPFGMNEMHDLLVGGIPGETLTRLRFIVEIFIAPLDGRLRGIEILDPEF
jgi:hypothetical protein